MDYSSIMESELEPLTHGNGNPENQSTVPIQPPKTVWNVWNIINLVNSVVVVILLVVLASVQSNNASQFNSVQTKIRVLQGEFDNLKAENARQYALLQQKLQVVSDTEKEIEARQTLEINNLHHDLEVYNATSVDEFGNIWHSLHRHDTQIVRLTNHTSNADVLDELKQTKTVINTQLEQTKVTVNQQLQAAQSNVSNILTENQKQLHTIEYDINHQLNRTLVQMKGVVNEASSHIYEVRQNVSNQLTLMSKRLGSTVNELSLTVEDAQLAITKQVVDVKDMIEQYKTVTNNKFAAENNFVKKQLAGTFVLLSLLIFLWHLTSHMRHYYQPVVQRKIMAVSCMVPIYSLTSWLSMVFPTMEPYLSSIRDCYEAYVVYTFLALLVAILSEGKSMHHLIDKLTKYVKQDHQDVEEYHKKQEKEKKKKAQQQSTTGSSTKNVLNDSVLSSNNEATSTNMNLQVSFPDDANISTIAVEEEEQEDDDDDPLHKPHERIKPPCPCGWSLQQDDSIAKAWLYQCHILVMQFVFVKPMLTVIPSLLAISHLYDVTKDPYIIDNQINWYCPNLYIVITQNISVALAFYGLLSFYHGVEEELAWSHPWPKFLCIKIVVFATFWQNVCIQMMSAFGWVDEAGASYIQNLLICIEMLIASIAHVYIFPHREWHPNYERGNTQGKNILFRDIMAIGDFWQDVTLMVQPWEKATITPTPLQQPLHSPATAAKLLSLTPTHKTQSEETIPMNTMSSYSTGAIHHPMNGLGLSPTPFSPLSPYPEGDAGPPANIAYHSSAPQGSAEPILIQEKVNEEVLPQSNTNHFESPQQNKDFDYHNLYQNIC